MKRLQRVQEQGVLHPKLAEVLATVEYEDIRRHLRQGVTGNLVWIGPFDGAAPIGFTKCDLRFYVTSIIGIFYEVGKGGNLLSCLNSSGLARKYGAPFTTGHTDVDPRYRKFGVGGPTAPLLTDPDQLDRNARRVTATIRKGMAIVKRRLALPHTSSRPIDPRQRPRVSEAPAVPAASTFFPRFQESSW